MRFPTLRRLQKPQINRRHETVTDCVCACVCVRSQEALRVVRTKRESDGGPVVVRQANE